MEDVIRDERGRVVWMRRSNSASETECPGPGRGVPRRPNAGQTPCGGMVTSGGVVPLEHPATRDLPYITPTGRSR